MVVSTTILRPAHSALLLTAIKRASARIKARPGGPGLQLRDRPECTAAGWSAPPWALCLELVASASKALQGMGQQHQVGCCSPEDAPDPQSLAGARAASDSEDKEGTPIERLPASKAQPEQVPQGTGQLQPAGRRARGGLRPRLQVSKARPL